MNNRRIVISVFLIIVLGMWIVYENCLFVQSEAKIRRGMLTKFPVGTNKEIIWNYAQKIDPGIDGASQLNLGWWLNNDQSSDEEIGDSRIRASISNIGIVDVTVICLFDDQDKLIEIYAWKTMDMP